MSDTCSGPLSGHASPSGSKFADLPMTSPANDSGACLTDVYAKRSLKSSRTFPRLRLCARMLWKLHISMATRLIPGQVVSLFFFFSLERHGQGGSDITSCVCTFQIWWITGFQNGTRANLSAFLLTAHSETIKKRETTNIWRHNDLLKWKKNVVLMRFCNYIHTFRRF